LALGGCSEHLDLSAGSLARGSVHMRTYTAVIERDPATPRCALAGYFAFCNRRRLDSTLDYRTPIDYEADAE